ncbi:MAG: SDR family oxidoreductase [Chloroflexota bacterium]|nr:SDR family oxidoreductase [Chloroflexota bacterium]
MDLQLEGKAAVVTGGSRGIGKAVALQLAREGCGVVICARSQGPLEEAAAAIAAETGRRCIPVSADTSKPADLERVVETAARELGGVDILVNNAAQVGGGRNDTLLQGDESLFTDDFNTKMMGYVRASRLAARHMVERGWGRIIIISGTASRYAGGVSGGMRNAAVTNLGAVLAQELGARGVTVNTLQPGAVDTEALPGRLAAMAERQGATADELRQRMAEGNAIGKIVTPAEIANVVAFLASPLSVSITGESISVSGGGGRAIFY